MLDPRVESLAELVADHSVRLGPEDTVLFHAFDIPPEVVAEFVSVARSRGSKVLVRLESEIVRRALLEGMTETNAKVIASNELEEMKSATAYVALRGSHNVSELAGLPAEIQAMWQRVYATPVVFGQRVPHTKWVAMRWPTASMAQQASLPTREFEDFYFRVCTLDYAKMGRAVEPLVELVNRTDRVRLVGPGTDLAFSIKDVGAVPCFGKRNIPDGECFSCPVQGTAQGVVQYNTENLYQGVVFSNIRFVVKGGRIVEASAGAQTERLNQILDTDEGARVFGEWSLGFNPHVLHPMKDTLFDEKIAGSFHLTPGNAYPPPGGNGNQSAIHWDIVCIQRPEYGGGEVWFDEVLIRKDGLFVLPELEGLNPEKLGA